MTVYLRDPKIIEILKTFSAREMKEFGSFIRSPFFSRGRNLAPLYDYIRILYPDFDANRLTSENIYTALFPGKAYTKKNSGTLLRKLLSELGAAAEEFMIIVALRSNTRLQNLLKTGEYSRRGLESSFEKHMLLAEENVRNNQAVYAETCKALYELNEVKINHYMDKGVRGTLGRIFNDSNFTLLNFFYFSFISNLQALNSEEKSFTRTKKDELGENFLEHFDSDGFAVQSGDPRIIIYNLFLHEIRNRHNKNTVLELKGLLEKHKKLFSPVELHELYLGLSSMCTSVSIKNGYKPEFRKLLLEIYKDSSENNVMINPGTGIMDVLRFRNVTSEALTCGEIDYARDFVSKYAASLPEETQKNIKALCTAMIEYSNGNADNALELISKVDQSGFVFINDLKYLQLKCYYDLDYYESADSLILSYRQFIKYSNSIPPEHKRYFLNFLKQYKTLWSIKSGGNRGQFEKLKQELAGFENSWTYKKLVELKPASKNRSASRD